ncbi:MAG: helix-turn-helix domain-containing protein [Lachnospirales bacterium]
MEIEIGAVIKGFRKARKMTLQDLAQKSELSVSYLSMLERGLNSPTVSSLQSICTALNISLTDLFSSAGHSSGLIRKEDRTEIFNDHNAVIYYALTDTDRQLQAIQMDVFDTAPHASTHHVLDEFGFILTGSMVMTVEDEATDLREGDSFYIPAGKTHHFFRTSKEVCSSIWVHFNPYGTGVQNTFLTPPPWHSA